MFNQDNFATIGAHSTDTPNLYSYSTDDNIATVTAAAYFSDKVKQLQEGDFILIQMSEGGYVVEVDSTLQGVQTIQALPGYFHITGTLRNINSVSTMSKGDVGYMTSSGIILADASAEATASLNLYMANEAITAGNTGEFLKEGLITLSALSEGVYFLSTSTADITTTAPSVAGEIVRPVGYAETATLFYFKPDETWLEIV